MFLWISRHDGDSEIAAFFNIADPLLPSFPVFSFLFIFWVVQVKDYFSSSPSNYLSYVLRPT